MKIWTSNYQLYPKGALSSNQQHLFRKGTLLRVEFEPGCIGYADLCPYQKFGDHPLEIEMQHLTRGQMTRLSSRSIYFARQDAEARLRCESLFNELRIKNHFFISDFLNFDLHRLPILQAQRFTEFKVKMGSELLLETEMLKALVEKFSADAKVRIDFNGRLSRDKFRGWLDKNILWLKPHLDFIEDPFSYEAKEWESINKNYSVRLALDLSADPILTKAAGAQVVVIKPAIQSSFDVFKALGGAEAQHHFVMTHYMDFPVGQMSAYSEAQKIVSEHSSLFLSCGLQHHEVYEGFTFQDEIKNDGPYIVPPEGRGIGFDQLLERQEWTQVL